MRNLCYEDQFLFISKVEAITLTKISHKFRLKLWKTGELRNGNTTIQVKPDQVKSNVGFRGKEKTRVCTCEEMSQSWVEKPSCSVKFGNQTLVTLLEGMCCHYWTNPAPNPWINSGSFPFHRLLLHGGLMSQPLWSWMALAWCSKGCTTVATACMTNRKSTCHSYQLKGFSTRGMLLFAWSCICICIGSYWFAIQRLGQGSYRSWKTWKVMEFKY